MKAMSKFFYLTLLGMFLIPTVGVIPLQGTDLWYVQYLGMFSVFCIGIALYIWGINKYLAIFNLMCWASFIFVTNQHPRSFLCLMQVMLASLAICVISKFSEKQRKAVLNAMVVFIVVQCIYIVVQHLNLDPFFKTIKNPALDEAVGLSGSRNQIGVFFASTAPLMLSSIPILLPFFVLGLFLSATTSAWAAFAFSVLTFLLLTRRFRAVILFIIFLLAGSLMFFNRYEHLNNRILIERGELFKQTISSVAAGKIFIERVDNSTGENVKTVITCNPWLGFGLGNFIRVSPNAQISFFRKLNGDKPVASIPQHRYEHAHNDYAEVFFELGKLGFISLMLIVFDFFFKFFAARKTEILIVLFCCIIGQMICAFGVYTVHTAVSAMLLIVFYGLFLGEVRNGETWREQGFAKVVRWKVNLR